MSNHLTDEQISEEIPEHLDDVDESVPGRDAAPTGRRTGPLGFARMTGSSLAGRDAAPWITDFLNAAYYRRGVDERDVDDLRLAFSILTTYWYRQEPSRRLHATDLWSFHRAFGGDRFNAEQSSRGALNRGELLEGADRLLGDGFGDAYADDARRAWGIAFPTVGEREAYEPEKRMKLARLGPLTPESAPVDQQVWHTYPPVEMPSVEAVIDALTRPETWPDYASEIGRFTPLRAGGLADQTFEVEVAAGTDVGRPIFTRGYVRSPGSSRRTTPRRWRSGSPSWRMDWRATATTSRARCPRAARRSSALT